MAARKVIITCAITGSIHTPTMSPHLPITPEEIAASAIEAAHAGAAVLHLHARDPSDGRPAFEPAVYRRFLPRIHAECDAVIAYFSDRSQPFQADRSRRFSVIVAEEGVRA